jgi:DNA polymerase delta subunit 1
MMVATFRNLLEKGYAPFTPHTYESNMPYALRFMIDRQIVGMGWVKLAGGHFKVRPEAKKLSRC